MCYALKFLSAEQFHLKPLKRNEDEDEDGAECLAVVIP
jgi:hypothetical protein